MSDDTDDVRIFSLRTHEYLTKNLTDADKKAGILLAAQLTYIGLFGNAITGAWQKSPAAFKLLAAGTVVAGVFGILFSSLTVYPRRVQGNDRGLMYWRSIFDRDRKEYVAEVGRLSGRDVEMELTEVNYNLAATNVKKHDNIRLSLYSTGVMLGLSLLTPFPLLFCAP